MDSSKKSGIMVINYWGAILSKEILAILEKYMKLD